MDALAMQYAREPSRWGNETSIVVLGVFAAIVPDNADPAGPPSPF